MPNIEWPSNEIKYEIIGYLSLPGVIRNIEAEVPQFKEVEFREKFKGRYTDQYPYILKQKKRSWQFRMIISDPDGCPEFLQGYFDKIYGDRINDTVFISELVLDYGFMFMNGPQNTQFIKSIVATKTSQEEYRAFIKGYTSYNEFIKNVDKMVKNERGFKSPNVLKYDDKVKLRKNSNDAKYGNQKINAMSENQMMQLGWAGETYIAYLLKISEVNIKRALGIPENINYSVEWFNEGVQNKKNIYTMRDYNDGHTLEEVKPWKDASVGKGCDMHIVLETGLELYIEVKTSRRSYPFFTMTSSEMQTAKKYRDQYIIVKINNFENLLKKKSPEIITIINPYDTLFNVEKIREATFFIGGN